MDTRTALIEMMRGYQQKPIAFFTGGDILDVEFTVSAHHELLGCVVSLTS